MLVALAAASSANAKPDTKVTVTFDRTKMCLHDDKVFTIGSPVLVGKEYTVCLNARPDSYYVDGQSPAMWVPLSISKKLENKR